MSTINLLPEDYLKRRDQQRANVLCLILFGFVMIGVVAAAVMSEQKAARVRHEYTQVSEEYRRAGELIVQMQQLEGKKNQVIAKAQMAAELLERVPRSYLLASLTNALPVGTSLTAVKLTTAKSQAAVAAAAAAAAPTRNKFKTRDAARTAQGGEAAAEKVKTTPPLVTVEVTGLAETDVQVAEFIYNMRENPLMKSVELVFSEQRAVDELAARKFQVTMQLRSDAQVEVQTEDSSKPATLAADPAERAR
jgi:Tfp pilus assembly protein PilN